MIDHPIIQAVAVTTIIPTVLGLLPVIIGIPAACYYLILIIEKITGRPFNKLFSKEIIK